MMTVETAHDESVMYKTRWAPYSQSEIDRAGNVAHQIWATSYDRWLVKQGDRIISLAGVIKTSLIGQKDLWFLLAPGITMQDLKEAPAVVRDVTSSRAPGAITAVADDFHEGCRFARFLGLRPLGMSLRFAGNYYTYYGVP